MCQHNDHIYIVFMFYLHAVSDLMNKLFTHTMMSFYMKLEILNVSDTICATNQELFIIYIRLIVSVTLITAKLTKGSSTTDVQLPDVQLPRLPATKTSSCQEFQLPRFHSYGTKKRKFSLW